MTTSVQRFASLAQLSHGAANEAVAIVEQAIGERGRAFVALSGGSTPKTFYSDLATRALDWTRVTVFWSDERGVAPDRPGSNFRLAKEALLDRVSGAVVHRMHGEAADLEAAAASYEREILREVPEHIFDLILLGLGADGHTASLFPRSAALGETTKLVMANLAMRRLTFTFPLLNAARNVFFLLAGKDKAPALATVLDGPPGVLPVQGVQAERMIWFVDDAAASLLGQRAPAQRGNP